MNRKFWLYLVLGIFAVNVFLFIWFSLSAPKVEFSFEETSPGVNDIGEIALLDEHAKMPETLASLEEKQAKLAAGEFQFSEHAAESDGEETSDEHKPEVIELKCFEIGPLLKETDIAELTDGLHGLEFKTSTREQGPQNLIGNWVYLAPERSLALARLRLAELKAKGLKDIAIVVKDSPQYAISLGLFRNKSIADERIAEISALGYKPLIMQRFKDTKRTWIRVEMDVKRDLKENQWNEMLKKYEGAKILPISCD